MKIFAVASFFALATVLVAAAPPSESSFSLVERETPTCWLDDKISGTCDFKCQQRGASSGSCSSGTCTCSYSKKRSFDKDDLLARRSNDIQTFHKRWSCQIGAIGGKDASNALCSLSCADASGGKKDGYCNAEDTCICKA